MKKISILLALILSLASFAGCSNKVPPDAPIFELTDEQRTQLEQDVENFKAKIEKTGDQENGDNYMYLADKYMQLSDYENALEAYKKAAELQPGSGIIQNNLAVVYEYLGEYDKSLEAINTAIGIIPDYAAFYLRKAKLLRFKLQKSPFEMEELYRDATALTKQDTGVVLAAAEHYEAYGQENEDITAYQQALIFYRMIISKKPDATDISEKIKEIEAIVNDLQYSVED